MFPLNLPNALTLLRILAVPVVVVALLGETPNGDALAAAVFALAALTDGLDGYFARSRGAVTTFGKLMDPLAAVFALIATNPAPAWVDALVYVALAATVISGADYFFGLRRRIEQQQRERAAARRSPSLSKHSKATEGSEL